MSFARRYLVWLLVPPLIISLLPAGLFLSQVIQLSAGRLATLAAMLAVAYATAVILFIRGLGPCAARAGAALEEGSDASKPMSECLDRTRSLSFLVWGGGGLLFALAATWLVMPTGLGFAYFLVASAIAAFIAIVWDYAAAKHRLIAAGTDRGVRYSGSGLSLARKIGIVFIGSLTIFSAALILLISSRVSTTLEILAITSARDRFQRVYDSANILARVDSAALDTLRLYLPAEYSLHLVRPSDVLSTKDPLTPAEATAIRRLGNGDSRSFISAHVSRFARLRDGSILVLAIPWTPYRDIPIQITLYTLIVVLFTTAVFSAATVVLSRDVTRSIHELRATAAEMADGHFDVAPRVFADDEVGQLAESFGETRSNLRRLLGRVGGSGATITDGVRVITGGTEMLLTRSRDQTALTESSSLALENVRSGIRGVVSAADTVNDLTQDASARALELQASAEEVARSMDHLFQSVEKTSSSTTEMNATMKEMSSRTEVLAGIGDEVLSFVAELDSTSVELLSTSEATARIAERVREDARAGGGAVDRTVEGINATHELTMSTARTMDALQQSVGEISRILNVIEEVANRTNLLSLNAAIIAAQAGDQGAGFTVVADEIRELAERTRGSTKEIAAIVKAVQTGSREAVRKMHEGVANVGANVKLAGEAAVSLAQILESANESFEMAKRISRSLGDQSQASRRLHDVTSRMSDHIAEIHRATAEQARGTQLMAQESERVRDIAAQVKNATQEQSVAGRGITAALEKIAEDARAMRNLLERQLTETNNIADASREMLEIAQKNDAIAREFTNTVQNLVRSSQDFETEVSRFRVG